MDCANFFSPLHRRSWTNSASYEYKNNQLVHIGIPTVCWKIRPPNSIKNNVNEKVDHIDNVVLGVLCLAISVILNKISIQSMNHNIIDVITDNDWELRLSTRSSI